MDKHILIVEDEPLVAMDLEAELQCRGWSVVGTAGTVANALRIIDEQHVDAAVLDINLRNEDTLPLAHHLEKLGAGIVFLSGESGSRAPDPFGDAPKLIKPVSYEILDRTLRALFEEE